EGNALAWWKAYKQAKGGDAWLITMTWTEFKKLFFLHVFFDLLGSSEQLLVLRRRRQRTFSGVSASLPLTPSCVCHLRMWLMLPMLLATMRSSMRGMMMTLSDQTSGRRVVIGISRPLDRVVTGTTVIIMTDRDQTCEAVVTITAAATTTTLETTTGIPVMDVTKETGVSSPTDLPILVFSSPGVPLRATPTRFALRVDADTQESSRGPSEGYSYPVCTTCGRRHPGECRQAAGICFKCGQAGHLQNDCKKNTTASTSGQADKKPGASGHVFSITEDHATKTS
nr:hypothetical protein [Tanacetum cinerariifolium]